MLRSLAPWVALAALAVQLPIFDRWLVVLDEGYVLQLADQINHGRVLYRDVYVDAPFPGAFYLLAAWFRIAGTSIWASRVLMVVSFVVFAACVVRIGEALLPRAGVLALAVLVLCYRIWAFPHWQIVSYSTIAATFLTAAVAVVFRHLRTRSAASLLGAGALAGAGILCKQDYGVGVAGALGLFLLLRPVLVGRPLGATASPPSVGRAACLFVAGVAAVVGPALALLAAAGALPGLVEQAVLRPLSAAASFPYTRLPPLTPLLARDPALREQIGSYLPAVLLTLRWEAIAASVVYRETPLWDVALKVLFYAPLVVWGAAAVAWLPRAAGRARRGTATPRDERRLLALAWAGGFLLAFNRPRDWVHLMMIYPPALVLGLALAAQGLARAPSVVRRVAAAAAAVGLALLAAVSFGLGRDLRRQLTYPLTMPRAGVWVDERHGPILEEVLAYVAESTPRDAPLPVLPLQPMISFLAAREGAAGFYVIWPLQDPARDRKIIADLEQRDVQRMIYGLSQYAHLGSFQQNAPQLFDYLARHYTIDKVFTRELFGPLYSGLRRRSPGPLPGVPLADVAPGDAGDGVTAPALWPFTPVMAQRVSTGAAPAVARFAVPLPAGAPHLAFAYGVNPERWLDPPSGPFTFTVRAEAEDGAPLGPLFERTLDPYRRLEDRRWVEARVDLSPYAGRRVTLAFAITAELPPPRPRETAGWAEPRIVP